jgi:hypothetical protein
MDSMAETVIDLWPTVAELAARSSAEFCASLDEDYPRLLSCACNSWSAEADARLANQAERMTPLEFFRLTRMLSVYGGYLRAPAPSCWKFFYETSADGQNPLSGRKPPEPTATQTRQLARGEFSGLRDAAARKWEVASGRGDAPAVVKVNCQNGADVATDVNQMPDRWEIELGGRRLKLARALWGGNPKSFNALRLVAWGGENVLDGTIVRCIKHVRKVIIADGYSIVIRNKMAKLESPSRAWGQIKGQI